MNHQCHFLAIVQDIIAWVSISRVEYSAKSIRYSSLIFTHYKTSIRLSAVINFNRQDFFNTHYLLCDLEHFHCRFSLWAMSFYKLIYFLVAAQRAFIFQSSSRNLLHLSLGTNHTFLTKSIIFGGLRVQIRGRYKNDKVRIFQSMDSDIFHIVHHYSWSYNVQLLSDIRFSVRQNSILIN